MITSHYPNKSFLRRLLARSRSSPLYVNIDMRDRYDREIGAANFSSVLEHIHRTRVLDISISSSCHMLSESIKILGPVPWLEELFIAIFVDDTRRWGFPVNRTYPDIQPFVPSLWKSLMFFTTLTHLKIAHPVGASAPSASEILTVLCNLSQLQELRLQDFIPAFPDVPNQVVHLPHLSYLSLIGDLSHCSNLMKHIVYPTSVVFSFSFSLTFAADIATSLAVIRSKQGVAEEGDDGLTDAYFYIGCDNLRWSIGTEDKTINDLNLCWENNAIVTSDLPVSVLRSLRHGTIYRLGAGGDGYDISIRAWEMILCELQEVRELVITRRFVGVIRTLLYQDRQSGIRVLVPALETIKCTYIDLALGPGRTTFDALRSFLKSRYHAGIGIQTVVLDHCYAQERQVDILRGLVSEVIFTPQGSWLFPSIECIQWR